MTDDDVRLRQILLAAELGHKHIIRQYLDENPPLDEYTFLPLVRAVAHGQQEIVSMIVDHAGADAFKKAAHVVEICYRNKDWDMAKYLVQKGAEPRFNNGIALFHIHCDAPLDLIKTLLDSEDKAVQSRFKGTNFMLTLARTAGKNMEGRVDLLEWALKVTTTHDQAKRQFFISTLDQSPQYLLLLKKYGFYYEDDPEYGTPLLRAIANRNTEGVRELLYCGVKPDHGHPMLPIAKAIAEGQENVVDLLLGAGSDLLMKHGFALDIARLPDAHPHIKARIEAVFAYQTQQHLEAYEAGDKNDMLKAAKAGRFPDLAKDFASAGRKIDPMHLGMVEDWSLPHTVSVLEARGELKSLLDHRLFDNPRVAFALISTVISAKNKDAFSESAAEELRRMQSDAEISKLRQGRDARKFKL